MPCLLPHPEARRSPRSASASCRRRPLGCQDCPGGRVTYGSQATGWTVIGWIEEHHLRGARNTFYFAIGVHPKTGRHVRLEGNTDFDDRVNVIADFHQDPMTSRQHLGLNEYR